MSSQPAAGTPHVGRRLGHAAVALWRLAGPHRGDLRAGIALRALQALFAGVPVALFIPIIRDLRAARLTTGRSWLYAVAAVTSVACQLVCAYLSNRLTWVSCYRLGRDLRRRLVDHLGRLPLRFHADHPPGDLVTTVTQNVQGLEGFLGWGWPPITGAIALPLAAVAVLVAVDAPLALAIALPVALAVPVFGWTMRRFDAVAGALQDLEAEAMSRVLEYVQGISVIRAFNQAGPRLQRFRQALDDLQAIHRTMLERSVPTWTAFTAMVDLAVPATLLAVAFSLASGRITTTTAIVFLVLVMTVCRPLLDSVDRIVNLPVAAAILDRTDRVLAVPVPARPDQPTMALTSFDVTFDRVGFGYQPGVPVLHDVSFTAAARSLTALVGPSGAGKTTALNLVAGFFDPDQGAVRIGGVDTRDLTPDQRFDAVSVVFQDVYLFASTIWDNIAMGRPDAEDRQVVAAAQAAGCHDFVTALPAGYQTVVGEGGRTLSGGEQQRIAIARAILKDAPIVLLDEATAAVDPLNERVVQGALAALVADKTLLVVAHRLSTIRSADHIVALEKGRVVESGTHDQLLSHGGLYARFWASRQQAAHWRLERRKEERS